MKRNFVHRVLTLTLVLAMTLLWLPGVSHAASVIISNEAELRELISASESGDIIILNADIGGIATQLTIARSITLDLNGHMMSIDLPAAAGNTGNGIKINKDVMLTIFDSAGGGKLEVINRASGATEGNGAAINTEEGMLVIQSGRVEATGGTYGAGIGGGAGRPGGTITISGGSVTATGGAWGAGIGGGNNGAGGEITISGGVVKAKGSYIHAAGIGGGHASVGGTVLISGGTITAEGAGGSGSSSGGAGIGGSDTIVSIIGGTVTATGCFGGAGIGGSGGRVGGTISIVGGTVHATGSNYTSNSAAGIGTGAHQAAGSTIEISGGTVTAIAGTIGNSSAVGRSTNGSMGTVSITGTYKFWLNTANTAPNEQTFVEGTFDDDNLFPSTAGYKYMKLESQDTTPSSKTYDVIFFDWDGTMLDQQIVESGEAAVEPSAPVRSGYSFIGWDQEFDNVTSDLTVTALYEICIIDDPFTLSLGSNTRTSSSSATVDFTSSAEGKYYYKVIGSKEVAPSADEIKSDNDGNRMLQGKNTVNISDLPSADACKIYIVGENNEGLMSDVLVVDIGKYATDTGGLPLGPPDKPAPPTPTPTDLPDEPEDKEDKKIIPGTYSDWAREELSRALAMGLIPTSLLNANIDLRRPISRVEFAGVTVKAYENLANTTVLPNVYNPFTDTQDVDALKAFNAGIMIGISLTEFSPHTELNREQAATALTRVFKRSTISGWTFETDSNYPMNYTRPEPFDDDADISDWAKDSVYFMVANRIILGVGYNVFAPRAVTSVQQAAGYAIATREQAILLALRMVENMGIEEQ